MFTKIIDKLLDPLEAILLKTLKINTNTLTLVIHLISTC